MPKKTTKKKSEQEVPVLESEVLEPEVPVVEPEVPVVELEVPEIKLKISEVKINEPKLETTRLIPQQNNTNNFQITNRRRANMRMRLGF